MSTSSTQPDWSELPDGLIHFISTKLENRNDTASLRSVCKKFQSLVPPPPERTLPPTALTIPYPISPTPEALAHYNLLEYKVFAIRSRDKIPGAAVWILKVQELGHGRARIKDALSRSVFGSMASHFPRTLNLLKYEIREISKAFELKLVLNEDLEGMQELVLSLPIVDKVVVSDDLDILIMHSGGYLNVWRKGDTSWTDIEIGANEIQCQDAMYYDKKFYAVESNGRTVSIDCKTLQVKEVVPALPRLSFGIFKYLMRFENCFHLIVKTQFDADHRNYFRNQFFYPVQFVIFRHDQQRNVWTEKMHGFQNRVFCVGEGCSYSFLASDFPGTRGNSIYFTDPLFRGLDGERPGWDAGIFNIDDYTSRPISRCPGYSRLFWPPPAWL
ncbi:F-box protein SKIP23-like [Melia azedarach]|uniref:F-box protein SKIP23-like n=1 Tax=Melia azedarach TaxID=155640 RepID=A0ACC1XRJ1_MELAZ|nr:F-box protein SKIP23-like [Melia azedarach]